VSIIAGTAANRLHIPTNEVRAWTLESADEYQPPPVEFPAALQSILRAERRLGGEIASQYQRLFDPAAGRVEWCRDESCDDSGFSVGFAGMTSGLFYGAFRGTTDNVRALAHEAGHAVHRQLLNENQPLAIYNTGPSFMFESFAIFSDLLALDHLYRTGRSPAEQAYYLHQFLEDAIHNVYGSAVEVDLETSMYAGAQAGTLRRATDLDKLSLEVISRYIPVPARDPRMQVLWARNRLYFTDPLYDVNYLFAGLLALEYLHRLESDVGFQRGYVALLKNGFTDTSEHLTEGYLKIDLRNTALLAQNAAALIESRAKDLGILYARVESARRNSRK